MVTAHTKVQAAKTPGSLIDEVIARHQIEPIRDDDITITRLKQKTGLGKTKCETIMAEEAEVGRVIQVIVLLENGHKTRAWRNPA
jgi:hypothetical protein